MQYLVVAAVVFNRTGSRSSISIVAATAAVRVATTDSPAAPAVAIAAAVFAKVATFVLM